MNRKIKYNDVLTKEDFYPPVDDRYLKSNVYDVYEVQQELDMNDVSIFSLDELKIYGGDNFADYCEDFYEMLDEEDYWQD